MFISRSKLVKAINAPTGLKDNAQLAQLTKDFLWAEYDPEDKLHYPTILHWDDLLLDTIENNRYDLLNKEEILSILFGLIHRNRIVEGLWWSMFERRITPRLILHLVALNTDKY